MYLYLHAYPTSPFAHKIRLLFGYKGIAFTEVTQPVIMPKPELQAVTGGYRRIPVLQIANHIICDTPLIAATIEKLAPPNSPSLAQSGIERIVAQWADEKLFAAAMAYNFSPAGSAYFFRDGDMAIAKAFAEDRKQMRAGAARMMPQEALVTMKAYLNDLNEMLAQNGAYLLGDAPSMADFSAAHPLWFTRQWVTPLASLFNDYANINPWLDRVLALAPQNTPIISSAAALEIAAQESLSEADLSKLCAGETPSQLENKALGDTVSVIAESFGLEETQGVLRYVSNQRIILQRDLQGKATFVHFPRLGFVLK